ncbi:hypothetical protein RhiXN_02181 [Rhizoctonia solani]|uniref:NADPH:adrenodoxin oxidoreductase, mitochondrial n=1 Tax=Rhizoctonia solani TaxID=456999 RepID=A0A8H8P8N1_9AGAM|nr:uncharacterized protein RhiXN_02181 [Rhizoctonia solani]QRW27586.1 hypothetical protein RhiXN_02181 [Rhizoctonia solani]
MAQPLKLAIIGGGASAFYAASRVLSKLPAAIKDTQVHVYDRLWTPHGLVRYGVAPDHPEVKATSELASFFGNVQIIPSDLGRQITNSTKDERRVPSHPQPLNLPLSTLARHYTHILLAYGSSSPLLPTLADDSSVQPTSALDFVHWYTSHPYPESRIPLEQFIKAKHITVIGHGNVALDVARVILSPPARLAPYDVPQSVLEVLEQLQVQHVSVVGRRAPPQVSFTAKEVREMMNLEGVGMNPIDHSLFDIGAEGLSRQQTRLIDLMRKGSSTVAASASRTWSLDFLRSPLRITPTSITYSLNSLSSSLSAVPTGQTQTVPTDLVIASVGYRSPAVHPDWHDERLGRVRHVDGQVVRADGTAVRGVYASGWAANAANTVPDNQPEAGMIAKDGIVLKGEPGLPLPLIEAGKLVVSYSDWKRIDNEEIRRGGESVRIQQSATEFRQYLNRAMTTREERQVIGALHRASNGSANLSHDSSKKRSREDDASAGETSRRRTGIRGPFTGIGQSNLQERRANDARTLKRDHGSTIKLTDNRSNKYEGSLSSKAFSSRTGLLDEPFGKVTHDGQPPSLSTQQSSPSVSKAINDKMDGASDNEATFSFSMMLEVASIPLDTPKRQERRTKQSETPTVGHTSSDLDPMDCIGGSGKTVNPIDNAFHQNNVDDDGDDDEIVACDPPAANRQGPNTSKELSIVKEGTVKDAVRKIESNPSASTIQSSGRSEPNLDRFLAPKSAELPSPLTKVTRGTLGKPAPSGPTSKGHPISIGSTRPKPVEGKISGRMQGKLTSTGKSQTSQLKIQSLGAFPLTEKRPQQRTKQRETKPYQSQLELTFQIQEWYCDPKHYESNTNRDSYSLTASGSMLKIVFKEYSTITSQRFLHNGG